MVNPLEKLVKNLPPECFNNLYDYFGKNYIEENIELLLIKGVFPYDWFDDYSKLDQKTLPRKEEFYSKKTLRIFLMKIIDMHKKFGRSLNVKLL